MSDNRTYEAGLLTITVLSRNMAVQHLPLQPAVMISISSPGDNSKPQFIHEDKYKDILRVEFHDYTESKPGISPISGGQAKEIAEFVLKHSKEPCQLVIHCDDGVSRSAGVAAAICKHFGCAEGKRVYLSSDIFYANRRVYRFVSELLKARGGNAVE